MREDKLFIVIVSYNGGDNLVKLINEIYKISRNNKALSIETIVVDNGSSDGSFHRTKNIEHRTRNLKTIKNNKNLGFAIGCNVGIKYALKNNADYILLLNQDVTIDDKLIELITNNSADIISPVIKFKRNNRWVYDCGGKINWFCGRTSHLEFSNRAIEPYDFAQGKQSSNREIDYVSGCCMLVKREVFEKMGLLDEGYFLYFEDVDFCLRAKMAGFSVAVEPKTTIIHRLLEGKNKPINQYLHHLTSNFKFINTWIALYNRPFAYIYLLFLFIKIFLIRLL